MGKLTIIPVCDDEDVKENESFGVYIDGECRGFFRFGEKVDFYISKDCFACIEFKGEKCSKAKVTAFEHTTLVASYDDVYGKVMFTKVKREKLDEPSVYSAVAEEETESSQEVKEPSVFMKLSKIGGWVHKGFITMMAILVLGVVIAFFVLLSEELTGAAFIVLGSGALGIYLYYLEYLLAGYFYFAAIDKGYENLDYLFFPWVFPIMGHLLIVSLPDRGNGKNHEKEQE